MFLYIKGLGGTIKMKKGRFPSQVLLYFLIMILLIIMGCSSNSSSGDTAALDTYSISYTVSGNTIAGATIYLSGAATSPATADADGNFSFTGLANGTYTLIPVLAGYTFSPVSTAVVVNGANVTGIDFEATANALPTYSIYGRVTGAVLPGVTITLSGDATGTTTTNASGYYVFSNLVAGDYIVTPSLTGYTFSPSSLAQTVVSVDIPDQDFAAAVAFTQADLAGTWNIQLLRADKSLLRAIVTIDETGLVSSDDCEDTSGSCPPNGYLRWTIQPGGEIYLNFWLEESSEWGESSDAHYTMTLNKNLFAGTIGDAGSEELLIAQKVVPETVYSDADLQGESFVAHQLTVGYTSEWGHFEGFTNPSGELYFTSFTSPSGSTGTLEDGVSLDSIMLVDSDGIVTIGGNNPDDSFKGFLSADKKTIVGTSITAEVDGDGNPILDGEGNQAYTYQLTIIQITGQPYTIGPFPAGTYSSHFLGVESEGLFGLWGRSLFTVYSPGFAYFTDWVSSTTSIISPVLDILNISDSLGTVGEVTGEGSYHGQMSHDGNFTVFTQSIETGNDDTVYSLGVNILTNGVITEEQALD